MRNAVHQFSIGIQRNRKPCPSCPQPVNSGYSENYGVAATIKTFQRFLAVLCVLFLSCVTVSKARECSSVNSCFAMASATNGEVSDAALYRACQIGSVDDCITAYEAILRHRGDSTTTPELRRLVDGRSGWQDTPLPESHVSAVRSLLGRGNGDNPEAVSLWDRLQTLLRNRARERRAYPDYQLMTAYCAGLCQAHRENRRRGMHVSAPPACQDNGFCTSFYWEARAVHFREHILEQTAADFMTYCSDSRVTQLLPCRADEQVRQAWSRLVTRQVADSGLSESDRVGKLRDYLTVYPDAADASALRASLTGASANAAESSARSREQCIAHCRERGFDTSVCSRNCP